MKIFGIPHLRCKCFCRGVIYSINIKNIVGLLGGPGEWINDKLSLLNDGFIWVDEKIQGVLDWLTPEEISEEQFEEQLREWQFPSSTRYDNNYDVNNEESFNRTWPGSGTGAGGCD